MAKKNAREPTPSMAANTQAGTTTDGSILLPPALPPPTAAKRTPSPAAKPASTPAAVVPKTGSVQVPKTGSAQVDNVVQNVYQHYMEHTPQRTKLIDVFLAFLVLVGGLQFLYCVLAGNYVRRVLLDSFDRSARLTNPYIAF